jgi:hypothetical protein
MQNTKNKWQATLANHAEHLEHQANTARLAAMAETPLDAIAVAWDVAMATSHRVAARVARENGRTVPQPPPPVSRLLTGFAEKLREKLAAVAAELDQGERIRLMAVAPGVLASIEANDPPVVGTIAGLIQLPPEWIALWLRAHLDEIEARFAS